MVRFSAQPLPTVLAVTPSWLIVASSMKSLDAPAIALRITPSRLSPTITVSRMPTREMR
jgi:hypothetical protein